MNMKNIIAPIPLAISLKRCYILDALSQFIKCIFRSISTRYEEDSTNIFSNNFALRIEESDYLKIPNISILHIIKRFHMNSDMP